jgi:hypothetical protein
MPRRRLVRLGLPHGAPAVGELRRAAFDDVPGLIFSRNGDVVQTEYGGAEIRHYPNPARHLLPNSSTLNFQRSGRTSPSW